VVEGLGATLSAKRDNGVGGIDRRLQHIGRRDSHQLHSLPRKEFGPNLIPLCPVPLVVRDPVDLDAELCRRALEVDHIRSNRMLVPELEAAGFPPQLAPQQYLRQRHLAAAGSSRAVVMLISA
jgi:hypothetical protein